MKLNQRIYKTFRDSKVNLSSFLQEFKQSIKVMDTSTNVDDTAEACHHDHAQWWPVATRYCTSTIYELDIGYKQGRFEGTRWRRRDSETLETGSPFWCSPNISPSWLLLVTCVQVLCWCPGDVPRVYQGPGVTSPHCPSQICFSFLHSSTRDPCLLTPALRTPLHILDKINIWKYKYVESDISCSITWLHPT